MDATCWNEYLLSSLKSRLTFELLCLAEPGSAGHHHPPDAAPLHRPEARLQPIRQHQVRMQGSGHTGFIL